MSIQSTITIYHYNEENKQWEVKKKKQLDVKGAEGIGATYLSQIGEEEKCIKYIKIEDLNEQEKEEQVKKIVEKIKEKFNQVNKSEKIIHVEDYFWAKETGAETEYYIILVTPYRKDLSSLSEIIKDKKNSIEVLESLEIILEILKIVIEVNSDPETELPHGSIKPTSIMVEENNKSSVYLLNFNLHAIVAENTNLKPFNSKYTTSYTAPEVRRGSENKSTLKVDQYAIAATLYALLAGKDFDVNEKEDVKEKENEEKHDAAIKGKLDKLKKNTHSELIPILERALSYSPDKRYKTLQAFKDKLELEKKLIIAQDQIAQRLDRRLRSYVVIATFIILILSVIITLLIFNADVSRTDAELTALAQVNQSQSDALTSIAETQTNQPATLDPEAMVAPINETLEAMLTQITPPAVPDIDLLVQGILEQGNLPAQMAPEIKTIVEDLLAETATLSFSDEQLRAIIIDYFTENPLYLAEAGTLIAEATQFIETVSAATETQVVINALATQNAIAAAGTANAQAIMNARATLDTQATRDALSTAIANAQITIAAQQTANTQATADAESSQTAIAAGQATIDAQNTSIANNEATMTSLAQVVTDPPSPTLTDTPSPTLTDTPSPTLTDTPSPTPTPTEVPVPENAVLVELEDGTRFYMDSTQVTIGAYQEFIDDGGYDNETLWSAAGWDWWQKNREGISSGPINPNPEQTEANFDRPRTTVTFYEAEAYCTWKNGRLPTEDEWESAVAWARANNRMGRGDSENNRSLDLSRLNDLFGYAYEWVEDEAETTQKPIKGGPLPARERPSQNINTDFRIDLTFRCIYEAN